MITKGTQEYRKAGEIANQMMVMAATDRWHNNSRFEFCYNELGVLLISIKEKGGFAAQVADTIEKSMNPYNRSVAYMSSKQAWILGCSVVENKINFEL